MSIPVVSPDMPMALSAEERKEAQQTHQLLAPFVNGAAHVYMTLARPTGEEVEAKLPVRTLALIVQLLEEMAQGNPVTLIPLEAELTTVQAARLLHVSRPYVIKLLEQGKIPYRKVGSHRRIRYADLKQYQEAQEEARHEALDALTAEAQRLGLYE